MSDFFDDINEIDQILDKEKTERKPTVHENMLNNIDEELEKGKKRLAENLKKEAEEIDPRLMFLKLKKAHLEILGLVGGAETRSADALYIAKEARNKANNIEGQLDRIGKESEKQKELFIQAIDIIQKSNMEEKIKELENKISYLETKTNDNGVKKLWKGIKGLFKKDRRGR
jgi:hypothetical protein